VQPNPIGLRSHDAAADAAPDASGPAPDTAPDAAEDLPSPGDASTQPPDAMPTECAPGAIGCSADGRSVRTCSAQGRWTVTATCGLQTECSGGLCLCSPEACDEGAILQTQTPGLVGDIAGGGRSVFLAVDGTQSSIRRFDVQSQSPTETVVHMGGAGFTLYALDTDAMGNLIWCSDVLSGPSHIGQLMYGDQELDPGPCSHVRRRDSLVYYQSDALYRRTLDASSPRQSVSREPMKTFEIAGDYIYFVGQLDNEAFLKRMSIADPTRVDTIVRRQDSIFLRLTADTSFVYVIADGQIFRVRQAADAQPEMFWQETGPEAWGLAQTDSHLYWSTTTPTGATDCSEAQVWRRPKLGGPATVLSRVPGYCAGELVRLGDRLYTAVWVPPPSTAPTKLLRIRL
jgi:hypothetical protein